MLVDNIELLNHITNCSHAVALQCAEAHGYGTLVGQRRQEFAIAANTKQQLSG
jgi:hypothetical protein